MPTLGRRRSAYQPKTDSNAERYLRKLVERCGKVQSGERLDPEFVVAAPQVLNEGMAPNDHAGCAGAFQTAHGS